MRMVISPSKTQDFSGDAVLKDFTLPQLREYSVVLAKALKRLSARELAALMDISPKLAELNHARYQRFSEAFTLQNARQAILAFQGDVYEGLAAESFTKADFAFAQAHLRILSGLYGVLRPLDLIQPYRLEMGTALKIKKNNNLYDFWADRITQTLNAENNQIWINLASEEYFKAVKPKLLEGRIITPVFKERHKGKLQVIGLFAKKARGMMANDVIKQQITDPKLLQSFSMGGYAFQPNLSDEQNWVFTRAKP